jgi:hypothetical protein
VKEKKEEERRKEEDRKVKKLKAEWVEEEKQNKLR